MDRSNEIELLRERLSEYERAFESASPRLAAFKRLEEIAREQKTTPEAVAAQAAMDVLLTAEEAATERVNALTSTRDALRSEVSVLLLEKKEKDEAMTIIEAEHGVLASEVSELMAEIESIRVDAIRLMQERETLKLEVEALRNERDIALIEGDEITVTPGSVTPSDDSSFGSGQDEESDDAFNRFFDAETGKDKARDWMLG